MTLPPFEAGAVKLSVAWALSAVAVALVGAPGTVAGVTLFTGVTELDGPEAGPVPISFVAVTMNV
jgi:hypothetical protein